MLQLIEFILTHAIKIIGTFITLLVFWVLWEINSVRLLSFLVCTMVLCIVLAPLQAKWEKTRKR